MAVVALVRGASAELLWGLNSHTRIARQLRAVGVETVIAEANAAMPGDRVLVLNAEYLFEVRTFRGLLQHPHSGLECVSDGHLAAAHTDTANLAQTVQAIDAKTSAGIGHLSIVRPADLEGYDENLRKVTPPLLEPVTASNPRALESVLYGNAYKGITDLVTKWCWPRPARVLVGLCARAGISPNLVTLVGLFLVVASTFLFAHGHYLAGLLSGWIMTLLDTVDGKLARVTVQSSRLGHVLDHGMDIIHPPIWYVFWGYGLGLESEIAGYSFNELSFAIVAGYIAGRLIEALFHALGHCSMFAWRPFDAYFRLVTARRNPCLIILTLATLCGRPDWGLFGVAAWTMTSSGLMALRLLYAGFVRFTGGPLESWLKDPVIAGTQHARAYRTFSVTRGAYE